LPAPRLVAGIAHPSMFEGSGEQRALTNLLPIGDGGTGEEVKQGIVGRGYGPSQARLPWAILLKACKQKRLVQEMLGERHPVMPMRDL